jgi:hypothetical protein
MVLLFLFAELFIFGGTTLLVLFLLKRQVDAERRVRRAFSVVGVFSLIAVCIFTMMFYEAGYTVFGALLYGIILGGLHAILFAAIVSLLLVSNLP